MQNVGNMMPKTEVAVEDVMRIAKERWAINKLRFEDIIWTYQGKPLDISTKLSEDFAMIGLNNCDFITSNFLPNRPWQDDLPWED
jgi:hypothetical protein